MQHTTSTPCPDTGLTDAEMRMLDTTARARYRRVLELINTTGCSIRDALAAVADADEQAKRN